MIFFPAIPYWGKSPSTIHPLHPALTPTQGIHNLITTSIREFESNGRTHTQGINKHYNDGLISAESNNKKTKKTKGISDTDCMRSPSLHE